MWLEDDDQPPMPELARRVDRGADLSRVVRVVVIDGRALEGA
jgi:hypothetical protein